jgi:hypothetical protein
MISTDTLLSVPPRTTDRGGSRTFACLIEVPDVRRSRSGPVRPRGLGRWDNGQPLQPRAKRRLRREVRVAGYALLALAPLFGACALGRPDRPARVLACSIAEATAPEPVLASSGHSRDAYRPSVDSPGSSPGAVILSRGAAAPASGGESDVPVVFPGYVLPDDTLEESTHEGS